MAPEQQRKSQAYAVIYSMDKANQALFPRFSSDLVTTALKDTPIP